MNTKDGAPVIFQEVRMRVHTERVSHPPPIHGGSKRKLQLLSFGVFVGVLLVPSEINAQTSADQHISSAIHFDIGPRYVHMPEGYFVLVRKGKSMGAIRLIRITQSAPNLGRATYESYFQGDGSGSFRNSSVIRRSGELDIKPLKGISHSMMHQPGQDKLWVGKWWFGCLSPSLINMSSHFSDNDEDYEFAPTSARDVTEIDVSDKTLRWFRYDANAHVTVSVPDLPK